MAQPPRIGDRVQLPSGQRVRIMGGADPARPWRAESNGVSWILKRPGRGGGRDEHYFAGKVPLQLDQADAEALAAILARVKG